MRILQKILLVEDEPDIQAIVKLALELVGGYTTHICASGEEAVQSAPGFAPDFILLDVMMPGMDGPTTLVALREIPSLATVPVAFITAKVMPNEVAHLRSLGAVEVIAKPFDSMALAGKIQEIWDSLGQ